MLDDDNIYFIDVKKHPNGPGFTSFEFLEIIEQNNWMHCTPFEEIKEIIDMHPVITKDEDIYKILKMKFINISFKINNKYYSPLLGITSIGNKMTHTQYLIRINKKIDEFSKQDFELLDFKLVMENNVFGHIHFEKDNERCVAKI